MLLITAVMYVPMLFASVVNECRKVLTSAGFKELKEREHWDVKPTDKVPYGALLRIQPWVFSLISCCQVQLHVTSKSIYSLSS